MSSPEIQHIGHALNSP